jgi:hypothetical protein
VRARIWRAAIAGFGSRRTRRRSAYVRRIGNVRVCHRSRGAHRRRSRRLALGSLPTPLLGRGRHDAHKLDRLAPSAQRYGGVDVEAPLIRVSWEDVGSGVVALFATVVVFGLGTERREAGRPPSASSAPRRSQGWSRRYWMSSSSSVLARALLDLNRPYAAPYPPESAAEGDLSDVRLSASGWADRRGCAQGCGGVPHPPPARDRRG